MGVAGVGPHGRVEVEVEAFGGRDSVTLSMIAAARSVEPNLRAYTSGTDIAVPGGAFGSSW